MSTYIGKVQVGSQEVAIGTTLYGTCNTIASTAIKVITLDSFDSPMYGITIAVKFIHGNSVTSGVQLQIGTNLHDVVGNCLCQSGEILNFIFDNSNNISQWIVSGKSIEPAENIPSSIGIAAVGSSLKYARENHVHNITLAEGDTNGQIKIAGTNINVHGLGSAAYTSETAYATSAQGEAADAAMPRSGGQFTGNVTFANGKTLTINAPAENNHAATKQYVDNTTENTLVNSNIIIYQGTVGAAAQNPTITALPTNNYKVGWAYKIITADTYINTDCNIGDFIVAIRNGPTTGSIVINADWTILQGKLNNLVLGPENSIANHVAVFKNTTGKEIIDSGYTIGVSVPANAVFTDTTYTAGTGLLLDNTNEFSVNFGNTSTTVAAGNHGHGNISNDGKIGEGNELVRTVDGVISSGPQFDNGFPYNVLTQNGTWKPGVFKINTKGPNANGVIELTAADLSIGAAMHFMGRATVVITPNSSTNPEIENYNFTKNKQPGDVILGRDDGREYVWDGAVWELLGQEASTILDSNNIASSGASIDNIWISRIQQRSDRTISIERTTLDTSGTWSGNAVTATRWANAQAVYVDLESYGTNSTLQGGSNTVQVLKVDGILNIAHGGTGSSSFQPNQVIISTNPTNNDPITLISRAYSNNSSPEALSSSSENFVTERDIYYGLPFINNLHNYTSSTTLFAPTSSGTEYQILVSGGINIAPVWAKAALIESNVSAEANTAAQTTLTLGNSTSITSVAEHSEGLIVLYTDDVGSHTIKGLSTSDSYTHVLPNNSGLLIQIDSQHNGAVGSTTQPVYVDSTGVVQAISFVANRLYYSASQSSFDATNHYASTNKIAINHTTWPQNNNTDIPGVLYVDGESTFTGILHVTNETDITTGVDATYGALIVNGGMTVDKKVNIKDNTSIDGTLNVAGKTIIGTQTPVNNNNYNVEIYGDTLIAGNLIPTLGNNDTIDKTLGSASNPWAALFLSADYGDQYTPIYWNNTHGYPAITTPTQKIEFTLTGSASQPATLLLSHDAITSNTEVISIIVTDNPENLLSPILWNIQDNNNTPVLRLRANVTLSSNVQGYVMISKTADITAQIINSNNNQSGDNNSGNNEPNGNGGDAPTEPSGEEP